MVDNRGETVTNSEQKNSTPINTESQISNPVSEQIVMPKTDTPKTDTSDIKKPKEIAIKKDIFVHESQFVSKFLGQLLNNPQNYEFKNQQNLSSDEQVKLQTQMNDIANKLLNHTQLSRNDIEILSKINFAWQQNIKTGNNNTQTEQTEVARLEKSVSMQRLLTFYCSEEAAEQLNLPEQNIKLPENTHNDILKAASDFGLLTIDNNALETFPELFKTLTKNLINPEFMSAPLQKMQMAIQGRLILTPTDFQSLAKELEQNVLEVLHTHPESKKEAKKNKTIIRNEYQQELQAQIKYLEEQLNSTTDDRLEEVLSEKIRYSESILEILEHDNLAEAISGSMLTKFSQIYNELPNQPPESLEAWFSLFGNEQTQTDIEAIADLLGLSETVKKQLGKEKLDKLKNKSLKIGKGFFLATLFFLIFQIYTSLGAEGNQGGGQ